MTFYDKIDQKMLFKNVFSKDFIRIVKPMVLHLKKKTFIQKYIKRDTSLVALVSTNCRILRRCYKLAHVLDLNNTTGCCFAYWFSNPWRHSVATLSLSLRIDWNVHHLVLSEPRNWNGHRERRDVLIIISFHCSLLLWPLILVQLCLDSWCAESLLAR